MLKRLKKLGTAFEADESGATAIEYGLIMALMTLAILGAIAATGSSTKDNWDGVADEVSGAMQDARS
ncbi:Flp family type IVb pilin [Hyphomonas sp. FCG-A18]|jgi:pilus assembly protein Flp/PilA|uniref:Flp family type IVb pilin n=1 Tax=Hyphomonas sp. FCG-A18 TaxID=3080019 RepID=UPI002B2A5B06|nr:Flp family type IVb pilin [Hyphomonas sp. FCG-A18]